MVSEKTPIIHSIFYLWSRVNYNVYGNAPGTEDSLKESVQNCMVCFGGVVFK
jgi:hypothetical protein